ncbi:hypothetical protein [Hyphococcus sp.]|uniref:hypothetical protein n=1 Tax=Hyphococcus sp. TaxID=2038636 RepID=UPI003CCBC32D
MGREIFQIYLVPGFVFQSVIVGGGYGTGREIAEFFLVHGPLGGLFGLLVTAIAWSVILAIAFEFARMAQAYNYRTFFQVLLGPFWRIFEFLYLLIALLVLAVLGSAAGEMCANAFGTPPIVGILVLLSATGALAYLGGAVIARALTYWSMLLYGVYAVFVCWVLAALGDNIGAAFSSAEITGAWHADGLRYAAYNLIALAAVLFVLPVLKTRAQALRSGAFAGLIGVVPGLFVFIALLAEYPAINAAPVPIIVVLGALNAAWFFVVFQIVLFGTFIETGAGIVHAINERIAAALVDAGRTFTKTMRLAVAAIILGTAIFLADAIGIIGLIAKGYGALSYAFIAVVVIPLLTIGMYRILSAIRNENRRAGAKP